MPYPEDCLYHNAHLWCRASGDRTYVLGITDFAQHSLGELLYLELPEPGATIDRDRSFGLAESAKVVSELIAPLNGTVTAVNPALSDVPQLVNEDPFGAGWLLRIEVEDDAAPLRLMSAQQYSQFLARLNAGE